MSVSSSPDPTAYLAAWVGLWRGDGVGLWDADRPYRYGEEVVVEATGRPFLTYRQRTWNLDDDVVRHVEVGYLRAVGHPAVELLVVQPTGISEIHVGTLRDDTLALTLLHLTRTPTAVGVSDVRREYHLEGDELTYHVSIAMNGEPLADHLRGRLRRVSS